jgi:phospholipid/cholesterol/gamma-HCH transport system permease protein
MDNEYLAASADHNELTVSLKSDWLFDNVAALEQSLGDLSTSGHEAVVFQCGGLQNIDIAGAWVLFRRSQELQAQGAAIDFRGFKAAHFKFLENITNLHPPVGRDSKEKSRSLTAEVGDGLEHLGRAAASGLADVGFIAQAVFDGLKRPSALALRETVQQLEHAGVRAIPVVVLLSFLMGLVLAYQGATQLEKFGAEIFVVDLVTIAVLREMGVIMTAIMVAGRSGSAFAASLGSMKLNEELDALQVMGLSPNQVLVAPRIVALLIALPLLTVVADIAGLAGGLVLSFSVLDMSATQYINRVMESASATDLWVGVIKAPVFALIIGGIGTLRGLQVSGSAEQLGRLTTISVVQSIVLIIVADALFTVLFSRLGI